MDAASHSSLYAVLGVDIKASQDTIRRSYLKLAKVYHPDRHNGSLVAKQKFQTIVAAFEVLGDARQRHQYDLGLLDQLDIEDYLQRFQCLILTACGLGMASGAASLRRDDALLMSSSDGHMPRAKSCLAVRA